MGDHDETVASVTAGVPFSRNDHIEHCHMLDHESFFAARIL